MILSIDQSSQNKTFLEIFNTLEYDYTEVFESRNFLISKRIRREVVRKSGPNKT